MSLKYCFFPQDGAGYYKSQYGSTTVVVSSNPVPFTITSPLAGKATGYHPVKVHFPRKKSEPWLQFLLRTKWSMLCSFFQRPTWSSKSPIVFRKVKSSDKWFERRSFLRFKEQLRTIVFFFVNFGELVSWYLKSDFEFSSSYAEWKPLMAITMAFNLIIFHWEFTETTLRFHRFVSVLLSVQAAFSFQSHSHEADALPLK